MKSLPPSRAERLLAWSLWHVERPTMLGDFQEEFAYIAASQGERAAKEWYWRQTIRSIGPNLLRRLQSDRRRLWQCRWSALQLGIGLAYLALGSESLALAIYFTGTGGIEILQALFSRDLSRSGRQLGLSAGVGIVAGVCVLVGVILETDWFVPWVSLLMIAALIANSWPGHPSRLRLVRTLGGNSSDSWVPIEVPARPFALSELVLCHVQALDGSDARIVRTVDVTRRREFSLTDTVRVAAAIEIKDAPVTAILSLMTARGTVIRTQPARVTYDQLEEVLSVRTGEAALERSARFAHLDATMPFHKLVRGRYRLRLQCTDGTMTSAQEDQILLTGGPKLAIVI